MNAFLKPGSFLLFGLVLHTLHAVELEDLCIHLVSLKTNIFVMVPLSTDLALNHVQLVLVRFSADTEYSTL